MAKSAIFCPCNKCLNYLILYNPHKFKGWTLAGWDDSCGSVPTLHACSLISLLSSSSWPERTKHIIAHAGVTVELFTNNPYSKWWWLNHPFQKIYESKPGIYGPKFWKRVKFKKLETSVATNSDHSSKSLVSEVRSWSRKRWTKNNILNILESYTNQQKQPTSISVPQDWFKMFKQSGIHTFSCFLTFQHLGRAVLKPADPNEWELPIFCRW